jgi:hypothetical protein
LCHKAIDYFDAFMPSFEALTHRPARRSRHDANGQAGDGGAEATALSTVDTRYV